MGPSVVAITLGADGCLIATPKEVARVPAFKVDVVDTTGAGDAFTAALAVSLAEGKDLASAIQFAGCNGALACTKYGVIPSLARRPEVDQLFAMQLPRIQ
jgi:sugar/nucleoside kinase (ribokinase family)